MPKQLIIMKGENVDVVPLNLSGQKIDFSDNQTFNGQPLENPGSPDRVPQQSAP